MPPPFPAAVLPVMVELFTVSDLDETAPPSPPAELPDSVLFTSVIPLAAISFLLGALVSRFGWIAVGKISGRDPEAVFAAQE